MSVCLWFHLKILRIDPKTLCGARRVLMPAERSRLPTFIKGYRRYKAITAFINQALRGFVQDKIAEMFILLELFVGSTHC